MNSEPLSPSPTNESAFSPIGDRNGVSNSKPQHGVATSGHFRFIENLHIFLWLVKDMCWCSDFQYLGMAMVYPTIVVAIAITWLQRRVLSDLVHNLAVCCWICANITWMVGEFYYDDTTRPISIVFFVTGLSILIIFYLFKGIRMVIDRNVGSEPKPPNDLAQS
jgi:hypothetical protein